MYYAKYFVILIWMIIIIQATFSCSDGYYGVICNETCGKCADNKSCDNKTGICPGGCLAGWKTEKCEECTLGYYGKGCSNYCDNCLLTSCKNDTGECQKGCAKGWKGNYCNQTCGRGTYGQGCIENCDRCSGGSCDPVKGDCIQGCLDGWQGTLCNEKIDHSIINSTVAKILVAVTLFIFAVFVVYIYLRRRRQRKRSLTINRYSLNRNIPPEATPEAERAVYRRKRGTLQIAPALAATTDGPDTRNMQKDEVVEYANHGQQLGTLITDLLRVIIHKSEADFKGFNEEYNKLPRGPVWPHEVGKHSENMSKNRFMNTFPYDHSRVVLKGPQSYINACYIDSPEKKTGYIASQGPMKNTLTDFWQMIWQENSCKIVMLANCIEMGKAKVERYWPEVGDTRTIGEFNISNQSETEYPAYITRDLYLINNQDNTKRMVKHFQFTRWPDHGIPEIIQLTMLHKHVYTIPETSNGPLVVHCSAGVGRTGTYIALDALTHQGVQTGFVNVFEYVDSIRKNRMDMVQTVEQYKALYEAVYEGCLLYKSRVSAEEFLSKNDSVLYSYFQTLQDSRPSLDDSECSDALLKENCSKNKDMSILPSNIHRPYLASENGSTDYINAVILPSITQKTGYFVTQMPMSHTVVDFWSLVYGFQSTVLVLLDSVKDAKSPDLVSSTDMMSVGPYTIQSANQRLLYDAILRTELTISKQKDDNHVLTAFRITNWPQSHAIPPTDSILCHLCREVMAEQQSLSHPGPVIVTCSNGASKCGMYCTIANAIQSVVVDGFLDVPQIVRQLQLRRPAFIADLEQYTACINSIKYYCKETCTEYANVRR